MGGGKQPLGRLNPLGCVTKQPLGSASTRKDRLPTREEEAMMDYWLEPLYVWYLSGYDYWLGILLELLGIYWNITRFARIYQNIREWY